MYLQFPWLTIGWSVCSLLVKCSLDVTYVIVESCNKNMHDSMAGDFTASPFLHRSCSPIDNKVWPQFYFFNVLPSSLPFVIGFINIPFASRLHATLRKSGTQKKV